MESVNALFFNGFLLIPQSFIMQIGFDLIIVLVRLFLKTMDALLSNRFVIIAIAVLIIGESEQIERDCTRGLFLWLRMLLMMASIPVCLHLGHAQLDAVKGGESQCDDGTDYAQGREHEQLGQLIAGHGAIAAFVVAIIEHPDAG